MKEKKIRRTKLPHHFVLFFGVFLFQFSFAQKKEFHLIDVETKQKKMVKDSVSAIKYLDSLSQNSYYFTQLKEVKKNGTITEIYFDKGKNYNKAQITLDENIAKDLKISPQFYTKNLDSLKKSINEYYRNKGFAFNRVKTKYKGMSGETPMVTLNIAYSEKRNIDGFVVKGYEKVPSRFVKNLEKKYKSKTYDDKNLVAINQSLQNHQFVSLERPPQTLFTKDSTQIYLFLQKKKSNNFDGVIGFGNDKSEKFTLNGTLNVNFRNMFNGFESVNLFWQRNPNSGQTFDLQTDIPYLFKSNVGTNINVNIYRQDSTFATVKLLPSFYYNLSTRSKIALRGTLETSTIIDSLYTDGKDYTKKGIGIWYEYLEPSDVELFLYKSKFRVETDFLSTNYSLENLISQQNRYFLSAERNFHILGNHYFNLRAEGAMLSSKNNISVNELLRFGGWNSLRGFNENSLSGDLYYFGGAEYRYLIGNQAFFDAFGQYGELQNNSLNLKPKFYSLGIGFNFFLPIGLMSFQISNGNQIGNPFKFSDTKIHWGILSRF